MDSKTKAGSSVAESVLGDAASATAAASTEAAPPDGKQQQLKVCSSSGGIVLGIQVLDLVTAKVYFSFSFLFPFFFF